MVRKKEGSGFVHFNIGGLKLKLPKMALSFYVMFFFGVGSGFWASWVLEPELFTSDTTDRRAYVCFSPGGNCERLILKAIISAKQAIWVQAYSFTSKTIADALIQASQRGVRVRVLCDKGQFSSPHSVVLQLKKAGIEVVPDRVSGLAHNKVLLLDHNKVLIGSYNFTNAANRSNAENLLYIQDPKLHKIYLDNWNKRYQSFQNKTWKKEFMPPQSTM